MTRGQIARQSGGSGSRPPSCAGFAAVYAWAVVIVTPGFVVAQEPSPSSPAPLELRLPAGLAPLTFRGHSIGDARWGAMPCERWKAIGMTTCQDPEHQVGDTWVDISYGFSDERLAAVNLSFESQDYDRLSRAFTAKFGAPDSTWSEVLQNRMGAEFANTSAAWRRGGIVLTLKRYGSSLDHGRAVMRSEQAVTATQQAEDSAAQRAKRDL